MAQSFPETAHLKTDHKAFAEGWDRVFGKKEPKCNCDQTEERVCDLCRPSPESDAAEPSP
jgi:hypothetical protein